MSYILTYSQNARNDLNNIFDFIADDNLDKAIEFTESIKTKLLKLKTFPRLGVPEIIREPRLPNSRKYVIQNYIAHYTIYEKQKEIVVTRILHGSRENYMLL